MKLSRRGILGTAVGGLFAGPRLSDIAGNHAVPTPSNYWDGPKDCPQADPDWIYREHANLKAAARGEGFDPRAYTAMTGGFDNIEALKSVSPAVKRQMAHTLQIERSRVDYIESAKRRLADFLKQWAGAL